MKAFQKHWKFVIAVTAGAALYLYSLYSDRRNELPLEEASPWVEFVEVKGQPLPIPKQWLTDEDSRIAHDLVPPNNIKHLLVPFDFEEAKWRAQWPYGKSVREQYFQHLCDFEAGEWIFKSSPPQNGFYWGRKQGLSPEIYVSPYQYEVPILHYDFSLGRIERGFRGFDWTLGGYAGDRDQPYEFVEIKARSVPGLELFKQPYLQLSGYVSSGFQREEVPMRHVEIDTRSSLYGLTYRGLVRPLDREHGIVGYELIVYDLVSLEVLALKRQFLMMSMEKQPAFRGRRCIRINDSIHGWREEPIRLALLAIPPVRSMLRKPDRFKRPYPIGWETFKAENNKGVKP